MDLATPEGMTWSSLRRRNRPILAATTAVLAVALAACSHGTQPSPSQPGSSPVAPLPSAVTDPSPMPSAGSGPVQLQQDFISVVNQVSPSVVVIETDKGLGSGIIFDTKGDVVTNAHVTDSATSFKITLANGRQTSASLVGSFPQDDLAVLKMSNPGTLHPASFADSRQLKVGDIVMAIGNPLGLQSSVTEGIVSALNRTVSEPGGVTLPGVIQTSAAINPGNSGGALVDLAGQVVGIPTLAATDPQIGGTAPGIGFAIPSSTAHDIAQQLIRYGHVVNSHRAFLGVQTANTYGGQGVYVVQAVAGGPAARAGIAKGDVIVSIGGTATPDYASLAQVLARHKPGDTVSVTYVKASDSQRSTVQVTLGQLPG